MSQVNTIINVCARCHLNDDALNQITAMLDDAKKTRRYGSIEIELRDGAPVVIREVKTYKIADAREINRAKQFHRNC